MYEYKGKPFKTITDAFKVAVKDYMLRTGKNNHLQGAHRTIWRCGYCSGRKNLHARGDKQHCNIHKENTENK